MNVKELLNQRGIPFKEKGKDYLVLCLNPEHEDSSPSMYIDKELGVYHCYACGFKGKSIHEYLGVELPKVSPKIRQFKRKLQELNIFSVGLTLPPSIEPFAQNYRDISQDTYKKLEAFTHSNWEGRLCFPITDLVTGNLCAVIQRSMYSDLKPKYLAYPDGAKIPFYPAVQSNGVTILVEGIFDVANLLDKGVPNVTQVFGASTVTHRTVDQKCLPLVAADTKKVVILMDNDDAGNAAAQNLSKVLSKHFRVYVQNHILPQGGDPGGLSKPEVDYLKKFIDEIDWTEV